jgi:peptide/nickel transport system permease protein
MGLVRILCTGPPLVRYVGARLGLGVSMLAVVSFVVFFFTQALPGDVAREVLGQTATDSQVAAMRAKLGLDHSVTRQYLDWMGGLARLDLGTSLTSRTSVAALIRPRLANSALLVSATAAILLPLALAFGLLAARRPGGLIDVGVSAAVLVILALPEFVIAVLVVVVFATNVWRVFPPTSIIDPYLPLWRQLQFFAMPVLALVLGSLPYSAESLRAAIGEELTREHILWARLSGVSEKRILLRHALPNALAPTLQVAGTTLIYLTGGIVAVENVFAFPGVGSALTQAVANRDIPVVQAISMLMAAIALAIYLAADFLGVLLTPRLRTSLS